MPMRVRLARRQTRSSGRFAAAASCSSSATAAARRTRSMWRRSSWADSRASARRWRAMALTTDTSVLTQHQQRLRVRSGVRARQVEALGRRGDVALGISTSGQSTNVVAALQKPARARGLRTIALTGRDGGAVGRAAEIHINVPSRVDAAHPGGPPHAAARDMRARRAGDDASRPVAPGRSMPEIRTETMTVNMGPQHPSTHGVLRLVPRA